VGGSTEIKSSLCSIQSQSNAVNKAYIDDLTPFKAKDFLLFVEAVAYILMEGMQLLFLRRRLCCACVRQLWLLS